MSTEHASSTWLGQGEGRGRGRGELEQHSDRARGGEGGGASLGKHQRASTSGHLLSRATLSRSSRAGVWGGGAAAGRWAVAAASGGTVACCGAYHTESRITSAPTLVARVTVTKWPSGLGGGAPAPADADAVAAAPGR